jgi:hypothetical protein
LEHYLISRKRIEVGARDVAANKGIRKVGRTNAAANDDERIMQYGGRDAACVMMVMMMHIYCFAPDTGKKSLNSGGNSSSEYKRSEK